MRLSFFYAWIFVVTLGASTLSVNHCLAEEGAMKGDAGAPARRSTAAGGPRREMAAKKPFVTESFWKEPQNGARRIVSGHELELEVARDSELLRRTARVSLHFGAWHEGERGAPDCSTPNGFALLPFTRSRDGVQYLTLRIPEFERLEAQLAPTFWEGVVFSQNALLCFVDDRATLLTQSTIELAEPAWAFAWGILVVALMWLGFGLLLRNHDVGVPWWNPLGPAIDRTRRYSLSLAQSLLWTYVTAFGIVFVWKITEKFLDITPEVLVLLGIGGGTALLTNAQKLARWQDVPERYRVLLQATGKPRLADLVTEDGVASVPKAQMLIFTVLISFTVMKQIWETYMFPSLSDGLVTLMGVSSALYVGNTLQKADTLATVQERIKALDAKVEGMGVGGSVDARGAEPERSELLRALRNYLT